jgi:tetratricopeptide (TPR) repeat protein
MASSQLELANREADRGNYTGAMEQLGEVRRLALSLDDPPLLVRTGLAWGNVLFCLGRYGEAEAAWGEALAEAERAGEAELAALCRVYIGRGRLLSAPAGTDLPDGAVIPRAGADGAAEVRSQVSAALGVIKTDKPAAALAQTVLGLAEKELGRYAEAENALRKALEIHEAARSLELAAYDWYLIASVRSVAGRYEEADEALRAALALDRRAENSHGIGMDWLARGDVFTKAGKAAEARAAYRRAADIFGAAGFSAEAAEAERRLSEEGKM